MDVFLRAVDLVSASGTTSVLQRSLWLQRSSAEIVRESQRVLAEAKTIRRVIADTRRVQTGDDFFGRSFALADRREVLEAALEAAMGATGAPRGNVQLAGADGLRIVVQRGFEEPFLEYFALVSEQPSACGRALRTGRRVLIEDVRLHEIFAGTHAGDVMEAAGARACQSTPLIAASGWILGMISTHFEASALPDEEALARVDLIARRTAAWLEAATTPGR